MTCAERVCSEPVHITDLIVDWIEQQCARLNIKNEAGTSILWVPRSKFMQQRTMWTTWGFGGAIVRASAFHLWVRGFESRFGRYTHVRRVSLRSVKSRGFSPGTPVSSHFKCWQAGLVYDQDRYSVNPSIVAVLRNIGSQGGSPRRLQYAFD